MHDIQIVLLPNVPERRIAISGDVATLHVARPRRLTRTLTAWRRCDGLEVVEEASWLRVRTQYRLRSLAVSTLALSLSLEGWPLVRSEEHWARRGDSSDCGEPEGLAYKIGVFEEVAAHDGWVVETPTIPGLDRWQLWGRGENHGRQREAVWSIELVLMERGFKLGETRRKELEAINDPWRLDSLLRGAATARSLREWWRSGSK